MGSDDALDDGLSLVDFYDRAPCGYISTDGAGTIIRVNHTLARWVGHPVERLLSGLPITAIFSVGGRLYFETHLLPMLLAGQPVAEAAIDLRGPAGTVPVLLGAYVHRADAAGLPAVVRYTLVDISMRRQYERSLVEQREAAITVRDRADALARIGVRIAALGTEAQIVSAICGELIGAQTVRAASVEPAQSQLLGAPTYASIDQDGGTVGLLPLIAARGANVGTLRIELEGTPSDDEAEFFRDVAEVAARAVERARRRSGQAAPWQVGELRNADTWRGLVADAFAGSAHPRTVLLLHVDLDRCAELHGPVRCDEALIALTDAWREYGYDLVSVDGHEVYGLPLPGVPEQAARVAAERLKLRSPQELTVALATTTVLDREPLDAALERLERSLHGAVQAAAGDEA